MADKREENFNTPPPPYCADAKQGIPDQGQHPGYTQPPAPGYPTMAQQNTLYQPPNVGYAQPPPPYGLAPPGFVYTNQPMSVVNMQPTGPIASPPPDYLGYAIFVTICCCWPVGIFAILKASECRDAVNRGDVLMAQTKSREAKNMSTLALGLGIGAIFITFIIIGVYLGLVLSSHN